ncbi:MAG TPA: GNAT family N-acetyltransferase [Candidatus Dormibacteraeota bacterium]|nr:GNAT family N-acetyltransferase [Candidatus Dormibacteraeota bacterium]
MGDEADLVASRLARGCRCFVVRIDAAIAGYGWLSVDREWVGELQVELKPRAREGYIWNCVTIPEHRRKGIFKSLLTGICHAGRRSGLRRMWVGSVAIPAEKAVAPAGFIPALHFDVIDFAGLHVIRVQAAADRVLAADAGNVLGVHPGLVIRGSRQRRH